MKPLSINYRLKNQRGSRRFRNGTNAAYKLHELNLRKVQKLVYEVGYTDRAGRYLKSLLLQQAGNSEIQRYRYIDKLQKQFKQGKLKLSRNLQHTTLFKTNRKYTNLTGEAYLEFVLYHNEKRFNYPEYKEKLRELSNTGQDTNRWVEETFYTEREQLEFQAKRDANIVPPDININQYRARIKSIIKLEGNKYGRLELNKQILKEVEQKILNRNIPWF